MKRRCFLLLSFVLLVTHTLPASDFASDLSTNPAFPKSDDLTCSRGQEVTPMAVVVDEDKNQYEEFGIIYEIDPAAQTAKVVGYQPSLTPWVQVEYNVYVNGTYNRVTEIADYAFKNCTQLECIYFSLINEIGKGAFAGCDNLRIVESIGNPPVIADDSFPEGIEVYTNFIDINPYKDDEKWSKFDILSLNDIKDPFKYKIIDDGTGAKYASVVGMDEHFLPFAYLIVPSSISIEGAEYPVKEIADYAFYKSDLLGGGRFNNNSTLNFSSPVLKIGKYAFAESTIQRMSVRASEIGDYAFSGCQYLEEGPITSTDALTYIGKSAFANCSNLKRSVSFKDSKVTVIPEEAFMGTKIRVVSLGNVEKIGARAFKNTEIFSVILPATLKSIGDEAFFFDHYMDVRCLGLTPPELGENAFNYGESEVVIPYKSEALYRSAEGWKSFRQILVTEPSALAYDLDEENREAKVSSACFNIDPNVVIPSEVTFDGITYVVTGLLDMCFQNINTIVETVEIPETVKTIGDRAFYDCGGLKSVNLPEGLTYLGSWAFRGCKSLTTITIPEGITEIGDYTFASCESLLSIKLHDGITKIGNSSFNGCLNLQEFTIPAGLTEISQAMLSDCHSLKTLYIPEHITGIGLNAFRGDKSLETVNIPENITILQNSIFYGCESLSSIELPEKLTAIGNNVFYGCGLESIVIPESVETIGNMAFGYCWNLKSITLPDGLKEISRGLFWSCQSLETFKMPAAVKSIGSIAFASCAGLKKVYVDNLDHWLNMSFADEYSNPLYNGAELIVDGQSTEVVELPETTDEVKDYAFAGMKSLVEVVIPEVVEKIGNGSFYGCEGLKNINIPETVGEIGKQAFKDCVSMLQAAIGKVIRPSRAAGGNSDMNFASVDEYAFEGCTAMKDVTIGANIKTIGDNAFNNCKQIATVNSYAMFAPEIEQNTFESETQETATLHVPEGYKDVYEENVFWSAFTNIVDDLPVDIAMTVKCNIESNTLTAGKTMQLSATLMSGEPASGIVWSSSNPSVAEVSESGLVTAVSTGTATIYATAESGARGKCVITVTDDSGIDAVLDSNAVRVEGNMIIAPEGTRIFDVAGAEVVSGKTLRTGVYIVCRPDSKPVKVVVR